MTDDRGHSWLPAVLHTCLWMCVERDRIALRQGDVPAEPVVRHGARYREIEIVGTPDHWNASNWQDIQMWLDGAGVIRIPDDPDEVSQYHIAIHCPDGGLLATLERLPRRPEWLAEMVMTRFLSEAARADDLFGYREDGTPRVAPLPVGLEPAPAAVQFLPALRALEACGHCQVSRSGILHWSDLMMGTFQTIGVLGDGLSYQEHRRRALLNLWDTMPKGLRSRVMTSDGQLDVLTLAVAVGTYRRGDKWRLSAPAEAKGDSPMDISTAKALDRLNRQEGLPGL